MANRWREETDVLPLWEDDSDQEPMDSVRETGRKDTVLEVYLPGYTEREILEPFSNEMEDESTSDERAVVLESLRRLRRREAADVRADRCVVCGRLVHATVAVELGETTMLCISCLISSEEA